MQPYTGFATVYDMFMDNVPYEEWAEYVDHLLKKNGVEQGLVLELGCGTGNLTELLAAKGYEMIGVDASEEMLAIAREKSSDKENGILYLCQDMREFELYGTVAAVVSVCDSMNYILKEEELLKIFRLVNNYLDPGGLFIFDLDTQYAYEEVLGDATIAENREEGSFIWENTYYEDEMVNEINLTLFLPDKEEKGLFRRYEETHYRRAYSIETIKKLLEEAGMEWLAVYDALTEDEPQLDSERVYILAREKHQENKLYLK
ncbi:MAG: class I SAM-dependent methyltransferase [Clostridiales bacterium]|jgi:SAM-dependent methyltransferase|nr:class I SAM-dependent methyltransferase [Clostridiales bacterium]